MSFLLALKLFVEIGAVAFRRGCHHIPCAECALLFLFREIKSHPILLIAAIKGTEWLNFGGTTLLNRISFDSGSLIPLTPEIRCIFMPAQRPVQSFQV